VKIEAADQLEKKFNGLSGLVPELSSGVATKSHPQSLVLAAALVAALPNAINTVAGLFRSDYSEKAGEFALDSSGFQSFVISELSKIPGSPDIYPSLDALTVSRLISPNRLLVAKRIIKIQDARLTVGNAAAKVLADADQKQSVLDDYKNGLTSLKAVADAIRVKRLDIEEKLASAGQGKDEPNERLLKLLDTRLAEADKKVADAKGLLNPVAIGNEIAVLKEKTRRLTAIQSELSDFITSTVSAGTDGQLKVLTLFRQELIHQACYPSDFSDNASFPPETKSVAERAAANNLYFVTLAVRSKPQSVIEKKSLWSHSYFASGLLAVDYQIGNADGKLISAGALWQGYTTRIPEPTKVEPLQPTL